MQTYFGFTRMPFGRDLAPGMPHRHRSHAEAVARITWCIEQHHIGVITGEVGAGKTVAIRAATTALDASRHVTIYLANPSSGSAGSCTTSSPPSAEFRASTPPASSPRPPTPSPQNKQSGDAHPSS
jgi:type II secretory pathway predicted ATPase ExeA